MRCIYFDTYFLFFFFFFSATPAAYEGSQARGATAAGLRHSHRKPDPSCVCNLHHSSRQHRILNPLSKAWDRTCNLMVPSRIRFRFCCARNSNTYFQVSCQLSPWLDWIRTLWRWEKAKNLTYHVVLSPVLAVSPAAAFYTSEAWGSRRQRSWFNTSWLVGRYWDTHCLCTDFRMLPYLCAKCKGHFEILTGGPKTWIVKRSKWGLMQHLRWGREEGGSCLSSCTELPPRCEPTE